MNEQEIERCLERFTMGKATDVMNFDYAGTLAYIQRLKAENAALRERLDKAVELPCRVGDTLYCTADCIDGVTYETIEQFIRKIEVTKKNLYKMCNEILQGRAFFTHNAVVSRLAEYAELGGEK